nr:hypothetical protein [Nocardia speluncae]
MDDAARIAITAVRQSSAAVAEVRFVLFDAAAFDVFSARLAR